MNYRNLTAPEIAASMGLSITVNPVIPFPPKVGTKALFGQYIAQEPAYNANGLEIGRQPVDKSEVINAQRNRHKPHQGQRECARRVKQEAAFTAKPQDLYFVVTGRTGRRVSKSRYLASKQAA